MSDKTKTQTPEPAGPPPWWQRSGARAAAALVLAALIAASVLVLAQQSLSGARLDLTENNRYTLSEATQQVLESIDEPITLRLYYSEAISREAPNFAVFYDRVRNLLEEYDSRAGDDLILRVINPEPFSEAEDRAAAFGLRGVPLGEGNESVYFGLVGTNRVDDEEVIPFFRPDQEGALEFELTKMIRTLARPNPPTIGLLSTLPVQGQQRSPMQQQQGSGPWTIYTQLQELGDVQTLSPQSIAEDGQVPDAIESLVVIHPAGLSERALYALDQYALSGRGLVVFTDPYAVTAAAQGRRGGGIPTSSDLTRLYETWGITQVDEQIAADRQNALPVTTRGGENTQFVAWLDLTGAALSEEDVATALANNVTLATAGILERQEDAPVDWQPLLRTSPESMRLPVSEVQRPDPEQLLADFEAQGKREVLAARLSGSVSTAFPEGVPAMPDQGEGETQGGETQGGETQGGENRENGESADESADTTDGQQQGQASDAPGPAHIGSSQQPLNAVVFADVDMLEDRFWIRRQSVLGQEIAQPRADNGDVVINIVEAMAGAIDLSGIRARDNTDRPFTRIQEIEREAEQQYRQRQRELEQALSDIRSRLSRLRGGGDVEGLEAGGDTILTEEQEQAIQEAEAELLRLREQLREVQRQLRAEKEAVRATLQTVNIGAVPLVVALIAIGLAVARQIRRTRRAREAAEG